MKIDWDVRYVADSLHYVPLLPFAGALVNGLFGRRLGKQNAALIACSAVLGSALLSGLILFAMTLPTLFRALPPLALSENLGVWFKSGLLTVHASFVADHLSAVMMMVVSGVSFLIHVYSVEYMEHDEGQWRFFAYLNLFVGFMLLLVMGGNLLVMFVGWEGVGLCSYLLIGFWYEDDEKATAGRKAFVVNRIGDLGFVLGIFTLFAMFGTVDFFGDATLGTRGLYDQVRGLADLSARVPSGPLQTLGMTWGQGLTMACLFLFVGATGKSAQFPLYVWLPDAMAGPTPVSALIHAATMVTAGVYMIARLGFLFAQSPTAMFVVTSVGAFTALFAALMGFAQNDIKKVLAYSTVSQLGFMIVGVGIGAYWQAVFHLVTHAFFKACLFLGSGSVILGCHHEQDIRKMGGLRARMPWTAWTFLIATFAITGVVPLSGFFSKDAILHFVHSAQVAGHAHLGHVVYWVGSIAAVCTAFYMFRLYLLVFEGEPRTEGAAHAHESGFPVLFALVTLAGLSIAALLWGWPWAPFAMPVPGRPEAHETIFQNFTAPVFGYALSKLGVRPGEGHAGLGVAMLKAWGFAMVGFSTAWLLYARGGLEKIAPAFRTAVGRVVYDVVQHKFYVDEIYNLLVVLPFKALAQILWQVVDVVAIDGVLVNGTAKAVQTVGAALRRSQNGDVQRYAAAMAVAAVLVIWALA